MKRFKFKIKDHSYDVEILQLEDSTATLRVNGEEFEVQVEQKLKQTKTPMLTRSMAVPSTETSPGMERTTSPAHPKGPGSIKSPLPGKILDIFVKVGDKVAVGQTILCLEAMKMENNINTDKDGVITAIHIQKNDVVLEGNILVEIN